MSFQCFTFHIRWVPRCVALNDTVLTVDGLAKRKRTVRRYWSKLPMSLPSETIMQWSSMVNTWYMGYMGYGHLTIIEDSVQCDIIGKKEPYYCGYNHSLLWGSKPCFDHGTFVLLNVDNVEVLYADQERAKKKERKGRKNHTHSDSVTDATNKFPGLSLLRR